MTLSPSTVRNDLKCGKGAISKGEKCTKGAATQAKASSSDNNTIRNVAVGLGTAAVIGVALYGRHKYKKALAAESVPLPKNAKPEEGTRDVGSNKAVPEPYKDLGMSETASDAELKSRWLQLMRKNHPDAGGDPRKAQRINAAYQEILRRRGRLDSIWADGFAIDWEAIRL